MRIFKLLNKLKMKIMLRKKVFLALAIATTLFASCSQDENLPNVAVQDRKSEIYKFKLQSDQLVGDGVQETLSSLHAYAYASSTDANNGTLLKAFDNISIDAPNNNGFSLQLPATGNKKFYFLANTSSLTTPVITTESSIRDAVVVSTGSASATMFYSKEMDQAIESGNTSPITVKLIRGVARIDVNAGEDANVEIQKITYTGGSDRTYAFLKSDASTPSTGVKGVNYEYEFSTPLKGIETTGNLKEGVFYVYENGTNKATIFIELLYNGSPMRVQKEMPKLNRNTKYTVKLVEIGQQITGTVEIAPWADGGDIPVNPTK